MSLLMKKNICTGRPSTTPSVRLLNDIKTQESANKRCNKKQFSLDVDKEGQPYWFQNPAPSRLLWPDTLTSKQHISDDAFGPELRKSIFGGAAERSINADSLAPDWNLTSMFLRADLAICAKTSGGEIKSAIHPQLNNKPSLWTVKSTRVWSVLGLLRRFDEYWFCVYERRCLSIMRHRRPFTVSLLLCSPKGPPVPPLVNIFSPNLMFSTFQIKPCIRLFLHLQLPTPPPAPGRYDSTRGTFSSEVSSKRKPAGAATRRHSAAAAQSCWLGKAPHFGIKACDPLQRLVSAAGCLAAGAEKEKHAACFDTRTKEEN